MDDYLDLLTEWWFGIKMASQKMQELHCLHFSHLVILFDDLLQHSLRIERKEVVLDGYQH